jgi:hypothetical protein
MPPSVAILCDRRVRDAFAAMLRFVVLRFAPSETPETIQGDAPRQSNRGTI